MTSTTTSIDRDALIADVVRWDSEVTRWSAEAAAHRSAAQAMRDRTGDALLIEGADGPSVASKVRELEDAAGDAAAAATAAKTRVKSAWVAVLEHDASWWDAEAGRREAQLVEHQAKTDRLLSQLLKHEGEFAPRQDLIIGESTYLVPVSVRSAELDQSVQQARLRALVIRDVLDGHNPRATAYRGDSGPDGRVLKLADQRTGLVFGLEPSEYFPDLSIPAAAPLDAAAESTS